MWANGNPCDCVHIQARSDEFFKHDLHVSSHMPTRVQLCGSCRSRASAQFALGSKALCLDWVSAQLPAPVVRMFTARLQLYWACLTTTRGSEDHGNTWPWLKWHWSATGTSLRRLPQPFLSTCGCTHCYRGDKRRTRNCILCCDVPIIVLGMKLLSHPGRFRALLQKEHGVYLPEAPCISRKTFSQCGTSLMPLGGCNTTVSHRVAMTTWNWASEGGDTCL